LPVKSSASRKDTTTYGWSALGSRIWGSSIGRRGCSDRWKIRLAQVLPTSWVRCVRTCEQICKSEIH
jgi:hypothetical protein